MTFYRKPILLDAKGLAQILPTVRQGSYGFMVISSWQAVVRGLIRDENDNVGAGARRGGRDGGGAGLWRALVDRCPPNSYCLKVDEPGPLVDLRHAHVLPPRSRSLPSTSAR
jgi:hypothetical protein